MHLDHSGICSTPKEKFRNKSLHSISLYIYMGGKNGTTAQALDIVAVVTGGNFLRGIH